MFVRIGMSGVSCAVSMLNWSLLLLFVSSELERRCGAISGDLPDRAHHVGHGADRHCGGEPTPQPQSLRLDYTLHCRRMARL